MDTMTYNDNNKYTKGKLCLDKLVSEHDKQIKKELIEKACEWLKNNMYNYLVAKADGADYRITIFNDLKQAMMEE